MTLDEVNEALLRIRLDENRSVFKEGYGFEAERMDDAMKAFVANIHYSGYHRIRARFYRKDIGTGEFGWGFSRWMLIEPTATADGVITTAFMLLKQLLEHEVMESFLVDEARIFNPHRPIAAHQAAERLALTTR